MQNIVALLIGSLFFVSAAAQDSLVRALARQHLTVFQQQNGTCAGPGWDTLSRHIRSSSMVLIGEDHFSREIPQLAAAVARADHFDRFVCEVDPWTIRILQQQLRDQNPASLDSFLHTYSNTLSFFALEPELALLQQLVEAKTALVGVEQIFLLADRLIFDDLARKTRHETARQLYREMAAQSLAAVNAFRQNPQTPFFLFTEEFRTKLGQLLALDLSAEEEQVLAAMELSRRIYETQSHATRIQWMKRLVLDSVETYATGKTLFKFGAMHMARGESLFEIFDVGNVAHAIADSRGGHSLHLMVVGQHGELGTPLEGIPPSRLDPENGDLRFLKPFWSAVSGDQYHCFDLAPLRRQVASGAICVADPMLRRTLLGYDYLIVIPTVTPAALVKR